MRRMRELGDRFHIILDTPEMVNVCFWYVPERLRDVEHGEEREKELGRITAERKSRMMYSGTLMISYQPLGDRPNFFRSIISNQVGATYCSPGSGQCVRRCFAGMPRRRHRLHVGRTGQTWSGSLKTHLFGHWK